MSQLSETSQTGIALFGLGRAGIIHFRNLMRIRSVDLLYVVESDVQRATQVVNSFNLTRTKVVPPGDNSVYSDASVTAIVVCSPTITHDEIIRKALRHGKAVFSEKPISDTSEGTKQCYEEAEKAGKPLLCSFNRRFDPSISSMRKRAVEGEIGKLYIAKTCSRDSPVPSVEFLKASGGIFHDAAVHDIDVVCWVLNEYPSTVYVEAFAHIPEIAALGDVDTVAMVMKFPSGAMATIDLNRDCPYGYDQRVEVYGSKGMLSSENQTPTSVVSFRKEGVLTEPYKFSFPERYAESYMASMEHFLKVLAGKEEVAVKKHETIAVNTIALACEESYKTGKPVHLDLNTISKKEV